MTTTIEATGTAVALLRRQLAGESMPAFQTPEADAIGEALSTLSNRASPGDLVAIGGAALQLLFEAWSTHLQAERAGLQAKLSAMRSEPAGPDEAAR